MNQPIVSQSMMQAILKGAKAAAANPEWPFGVLSDAEVAALSTQPGEFVAGIYGPDGCWLGDAASTISLVA